MCESHSAMDSQISRRLSWLLRHGADTAGVRINSEGFVCVADVLRLPTFKNCVLSDILRIVREDKKQRYALRGNVADSEKLEIRASQGHSIASICDLELEPVSLANAPPTIVHGTFYRFWPLIKSQGLKAMSRNHIHFGEEASQRSGVRPNADIFVYVDVAAMLRDGVPIVRSKNNVYLSPGIGSERCIPPEYFSHVIDRKTGMQIPFKA